MWNDDKATTTTLQGPKEACNTPRIADKSNNDTYLRDSTGVAKATDPTTELDYVGPNEATMDRRENQNIRDQR